jgi:hypothetical protein
VDEWEVGNEVTGEWTAENERGDYVNPPFGLPFGANPWPRAVLQQSLVSYNPPSSSTGTLRESYS